MAAKAKSKVTALLRCRYFYSMAELMRQFKTHVLGHLELNIGGFYHATATSLAPLDNIQRSVLGQLGICLRESFLRFNLLPLCSRRDIAMLGLIYRVAHGHAHPQLQALFPKSLQTYAFDTRLRANRHSLQLVEERCGTHHKLIERSVFGLVRVWNRLPQSTVEAQSVTAFQKVLTELVRTRCRLDLPGWEKTLCPRRLLTSEHESQFFDVVSYCM